MRSIAAGALSLHGADAVLSCLVKYLADCVEYHANGGGGGLWHATCDRHQSGQLSFIGSWSLP